MSTRFTPPWLEGPPPPGSWRALFKWGAPEQTRHPGPRLYHLLKQVFGMTDEDFRRPIRTGLEPAAATGPDTDQILMGGEGAFGVLSEMTLKVFRLSDPQETEVAFKQYGLERVRQGVRAFCAGRPRTLCLTHLSHCYPQGASLYFIFMAKMDAIRDYLAFQAGILDVIRDQMELFRAIKRHLDPQGLMNPGGTLGLDTVPPKPVPVPAGSEV